MAGLRRLGRRGRGGMLGRAWEKGAVELGVVAAAGALLVGAVAGQGLANVAVDVADGLTWLPDDSTGQVVQVNPNTGEPQARLQVGGDSSRLQINQEDGRLLVSDGRTGMVTAVDLGSLLASGRRQGAAGSDGKLLVGGGNVFLADLSEATLRRVDPVTLDPIGMVLRVDRLSDAVVDRAGDVWLMGEDGTLSRTRWSQPASRFVMVSETRIEGAGPGTRLVPHDKGVTIFGPAGGVVRQVGTGKDVVLAMNGMRGAVEVAASSPTDLVAAALPDSGSVVVVSRGNAREMALAELGCRKPGAPTVFGGKVYVPCRGDGRVVVLKPSGERAGPDILVDEGDDPVLVVDDGRLVVSAPGATKGVSVDPSGATRSITLRSDKAPVQDVSKPPPPVVLPPVPPALNPTPTTSTPPRHQDEDDDDRGSSSTTPPRNTGTHTPKGPNGSSGNGGGHGGSQGGQPGSGTSTTRPPTTTGPATGTPLAAPTGVTATAQADGTVRVTWAPTSAPVDGYTVEPVGGGAGTTAKAGSTSATVTGLAAGSTVSFVVVATADGKRATSQPSNQVTVGSPGTPPPASGPAAPGAPGAVAASATTPDGNGTTVSVSWGAAGGEVSGYELSWSGAATGSAQVGGTSHSFAVPCGATVCASQTSISFSVVAIGPGGRSAATAGAAAVAATPPPAVDNSVVPADGGAVVDAVYEDFPEIGSPVNAYVGAAWASHPGTCTLYFTLNGGAQQSRPMTGCGAQTIAIGTVARINRTYQVHVVATSVDGSRTAASAVTAGTVGGAPLCSSTASAPGNASGFEVLPAGAPMLPPPCECPGTPNPGGPVQQCPVAPVSAPGDGTDGRYAWASVLFGAAGLLRLARVRVLRTREEQQA